MSRSSEVDDDTRVYWRAGKEIADNVRGFLRERQAMINRACIFSKNQDAHPTKVVTTESWGTWRVVALIFPEGERPDEKLWCRLKDSIPSENLWRPRFSRSKNSPSAELLRVWSTFEDHSMGQIKKLIGMPVFNGLAYVSPGVNIIKGNVYIITPGGFKAKGCTRISDIEYERLTKKPRKSKRRVK